MVELLHVSPAEKAALFELVDEYLAELATHRERPIGPTAAAEYQYLPEYWREVGRHPFFVYRSGQLAGFVLVREVPGQRVIQMSDFFIRPPFRRAGVGRATLAQLWRRFPGSWELQVHPRNEAASAFWPRCIAEFSAGPIRSEEAVEEDGRRVQYNFEIAAV